MSRAFWRHSKLWFQRKEQKRFFFFRVVFIKQKAVNLNLDAITQAERLKINTLKNKIWNSKKYRNFGLSGFQCKNKQMIKFAGNLLPLNTIDRKASRTSERSSNGGKKEFERRHFQKHLTFFANTFSGFRRKEGNGSLFYFIVFPRLTIVT